MAKEYEPPPRNLVRHREESDFTLSTSQGHQQTVNQSRDSSDFLHELHISSLTKFSAANKPRRKHLKAFSKRSDLNGVPMSDENLLGHLRMEWRPKPAELTVCTLWSRSWTWLWCGKRLLRYALVMSSGVLLVGQKELCCCQCWRWRTRISAEVDTKCNKSRNVKAEEIRIGIFRDINLNFVWFYCFHLNIYWFRKKIKNEICKITTTKRKWHLVIRLYLCCVIFLC